MLFRDRADAGRRLAESLRHLKGTDVVVLGLTRGGVVPAAEIARELQAQLDIIIPRKIGHPYNPEYAIGAVAEDGHIVLEVPAWSDIDKKWLDRRIEEERAEARRRRERYMQGRRPVDLTGKTAILVDDGIATGLTMKLAVLEVRHRNPARILIAVPVAPPEAARELAREVDEVVTLDVPDYFLGAVGAYYEEFYPVEDEEVIRLLSASANSLIKPQEPARAA